MPYIRILRNLSKSAQPLYFDRVTDKGTAIKDMKDPYGHFIHNGELFFKGNYLKLTR